MKVSYQEVQEIRQLLLVGTKQTVIAKKFNVSQAFVSQINRGHRKNYLSVTANQSVIK